MLLKLEDAAPKLCKDPLLPLRGGKQGKQQRDCQDHGPAVERGGYFETGLGDVGNTCLQDSLLFENSETSDSGLNTII